MVPVCWTWELYISPEEGHAEAQLDPAGPAQLVRGEPGLDLRVGGDLLHPHPPHLHLGQERADDPAQHQPAGGHLVRVGDDEGALQDQSAVQEESEFSVEL